MPRCIKIIQRFPRAILALSLAACLASLSTPVAGASNRLLFYTVTFYTMRGDGISVELIYNDEPRDEYIFYSVPSWFENPLYPTMRDPLVKISVRDVCGSYLPVTFEPYINGTQRFRFPHGDGGPYQIFYLLDFSGFDPEDIDAGPLPHLTDIDGFLYGNYLFVYPATEDILAEDFRTRDYEIRVLFRNGDNMRLLSVPPKVNPATPYELIFFQLYLGDNQIYQGIAAGISYDLVFHHHLPTAEEFDYFHSALPEQIAEVVGFFGGPCVSNVFLTISADNSFSGMEGTNGFSLEFPNGLIDFSDLYNPFTQVIAEIIHHETIHLWIGVRLGELEDPWFKEGLTTYLGLLLAMESGFVTEEYFRNSIVNDQSGNPVVEHIALSDPQLRIRLFDDILWSNLVYVKGAQVAFLLDLAIRNATGNEKTLRDVLLYLWSRFAPGAFNREEFLEGIDHSSGFDARLFFQRFIDTPGAFSVEELERAVHMAREYGMFRRAGWRIGMKQPRFYSTWMMEEAMRHRMWWLKN